MPDIKQISPTTRIWPVNKDRNKNSGDGSQPNQNEEKKHEDKPNHREQDGDSSHIDEYV